MATVLVVVTGLLFWRLSAGPIQLDFMAPALESAMSEPERGYLVRIAAMSLEAGEGLALKARRVRVLAPDGTTLASSPEVRLGISRQALLRGVIAPSSIDLTGVRVRLYRTHEGSLRFTLTDIEGEGPPGSSSTPEFDVSDFLREPDPSKTTGYLQRLTVSDGTVVLSDERSGTVWLAPGANFSIARDRGQITVGLRMTLDTVEGEQRLDASGGMDLESGEAWLDLGIGALRLAALAPLLPVLERADAVDMAFDASASVRFDADGSIRQGRFRVSGREGFLRVGKEAPPVPIAAMKLSGLVEAGGDRITVEDASLAIGRDVIRARGSVGMGDGAVSIESTLSGLNPATIAAELPFLAEAGRVSIRLGGRVAARLSEQGDVERVTFDLEGEDGTLAVTEPVPLSRLSLSGSMAGASGEIRVDQLVLDLGRPVLEGSGLASPDGDGWKIDLQAVARDIPVDSLDRLWPAGVVEGGRRWITENLTGGRVGEAALNLSTTIGSTSSEPSEQISGSLAFDGVTVRYWEPLPPFDNVGGRASFSGRTFDVDLEGGRVGNISLREGKVRLTGLGLEPGEELGDIEVVLAGPLSEILTVLDYPPLGYAKWLEVDPAQVGGDAVTTLAVKLPLLDDLTLDEVSISAEADLRQVAMPAIVAGRDLEAADLTLAVDKTRLRLSGEGRLAGMQSRLDLTQTFEGENPGSRFEVAGVLTDQVRAGLEPALDEHLSGPVPMRLVMTEGAGGGRLVEAEFDLRRAALSVPQLSWSKPVDSPGTASVRLQLEGDRLVRVESFEVSSDTGYAKGRATMAPDGDRLQRLEVERLRTGERTDVAAVLDFAADGTITARISGTSVDLSPLMEGAEQPAAADTQEDTPRDILLEARVGEVWVGARHPILGVEGHLQLDGGTVRGGEARGDIGVGNAVRLVMGEADGERRLRLGLDDAGAALRTLGWVDGLSGGRLEITAARAVGPEDAPWRGRVESGPFRLSDAPLAARLLAAASFSGLADLSSQDAGISFERLEAPFVLGNSRLQLRPGRAYGGSLGITFFGSADLETDLIDVAGTIVPAYAVNRVLGSIPLLGTLLTGGEGSGVFAATYRARGPLDEPEISVNPLAALAPGFLRTLFGEIAGKGSDEPEPATDPAAERFPGNLN